MSKGRMVVDTGWLLTVVFASFLLGWIWASVVSDKDVSQFGTQLQCVQQGDGK